MNKKFLSAMLALMLTINSGSSQNKNVNFKSHKSNSEIISTLNDYKEKLVRYTPDVKDIVISAIGDCTLGTDPNFGYERSFVDVASKNDYSYFFSGVYDVLSNDDLTIANFEGTLTDSNVRNKKTFTFKGDKDYTNILTSGSIEAVNLANNHSYDYLDKGYEDTKEALENAGIPYFGYSNYKIIEVDGIRIGLAGITGWSEEAAKENTTKAIDYFNSQETDLIIVSYHWGIEREYVQNTGQESIARFAIDSGADLVIGHHPHVLQGIEKYNGKYIVYSLGNFVFGGNKNPKDKDTMIFQQTFHFEDDKLVNTSIEIIPCSLSSRSDLNDYRPIVLEDEEKSRVLNKVLSSSINLDYQSY